ncbi:MAG: hypothetical protein IKS07_02300 [Lachnospiraceae bacterium]|nr:hypothetical protein [Lachnospiraceae bacterium]
MDYEFLTKYTALILLMYVIIASIFGAILLYQKFKKNEKIIAPKLLAIVWSFGANWLILEILKYVAMALSK